MMDGKRKRKLNTVTKDLSKKPRKEFIHCSILPSPELLEGSSLKTVDETNTIDDFRELFKWFDHFIEHHSKKVSLFLRPDVTQDTYNGLIKVAFSSVLWSLRDTTAPELSELLIWYYTGHGLPPDKLPNTLSTPELRGDGRLTGRRPLFTEKPRNNKIFNQYNNVTGNNKVKGGELCLHQFGFCGLEGLLKPWIASVIAESEKAPRMVKKNKHLVIILDSCYSGILAKDLEELNSKSGPWNTNGCTVTVQTACGPDVTFGGYFTPCFKFFNQPENQDLLTTLRNQWNEMDDEQRGQFSKIQLPSPMLVTTRNLNNEEKKMPIIVMDIQNFKLNLFQDPGFFKFCSIRQFKQAEDKLFATRILNSNTTSSFMNSHSFKVLDYKLKTLTNGPYADTPMGLFLLQDPSDPDYAICAHVHFERNDTSKIGRINLVHHKKPPMDSTLFIEDHDGLSKNQIKKSRYKIEYAMVPTLVNANKNDPSHWLKWEWETATGIPTGFNWPSDVVNQAEKETEVRNAIRLIADCHGFVEANEHGTWADVSNWNMDSGVNGKLRKKQRSAWMNQYLEKYGYTYQDQSSSTSVQ